MKGLSTDREDNIFFHMFSLQKKKSHRNWKIETKTKKQALWVFLHLTLPPCQVTYNQGREVPKIKTEKLRKQISPGKKNKIQSIKPYHQKHTSAVLTLFLGGIRDRKKNCLSKVVTTDLFPEPNLVMDREVPPMKPDAQQVGTLGFYSPQ